MNKIKKNSSNSVKTLLEGVVRRELKKQRLNETSRITRQQVIKIDGWEEHPVTEDGDVMYEYNNQTGVPIVVFHHNPTRFYILPKIGDKIMARTSTGQHKRIVFDSQISGNSFIGELDGMETEFKVELDKQKNIFFRIQDN